MGEIDDDNKEENVKHEKPLFFVFVVAKFFSYRMKTKGSSGIFVSKENMHKESHHQKKRNEKMACIRLCTSFLLPCLLCCLGTHTHFKSL